jgi:hypothetical protein
MKNNRLPYVSIIVILLATALILHQQGRLWICSCGRVLLWAGDIWSSDNSQHIFDPYSFTHILHGFLFAWILLALAAKVKDNWQLVITIILESLWEIFENSKFIIDRYREGTVSLGYTGDTVINSISDILLCGAGFYIARKLGWKKSLIVFVVIELILLFWIRDNLTLNILMLIHPIEGIKQWQAGN